MLGKFVKPLYEYDSTVCKRENIRNDHKYHPDNNNDDESEIDSSFQ